MKINEIKKLLDPNVKINFYLDNTKIDFNDIQNEEQYKVVKLIPNDKEVNICLQKLKTKKVLLNKDYGGFKISDEVQKEYFSRTGIEISKYCNDKREDEVLIDIVERLGEKVNVYSELVIVEIPEDLDYVIDDYDGFETLHEEVKEW